MAGFGYTSFFSVHGWVSVGYWLLNYNMEEDIAIFCCYFADNICTTKKLKVTVS